MPGFNDAHIHLMTGGAQLDSVDLRRGLARGVRAANWRARQVTPRASGSPAAIGTSSAGPARRLPTRELVDRLTPDTPVFVNRYDEHMALANSVALRLAGITATTPDPPGGLIVRDAAGQPDGHPEGRRHGAVYRVMPAPTLERRDRTLRRALGAHGVARRDQRAGHGARPGRRDRYATLAAGGELTARIRAVPAGAAGWPASASRNGEGQPLGLPARFLARRRSPTGRSVPPRRSSSSRTRDDPTTRGLLADEMQPLEGMRSRLTAIDKAGEQLCVHAIGDQAISMVLDLFADVEKANGPPRPPAADRALAARSAEGLRAVRAARRHRLRAALPRDRRREVGREADWRRAGEGDIRVPVVPRPSACGWRSAPTGRSRRSTRCRRCMPPSLVPRSTASTPAAGCLSRR